MFINITCSDFYICFRVVRVGDCKYFKKNMTLDQLPEFVCVGSISRSGDNIMPNQHTEILPGDELLLFTKEKNIIKAENLFL